MSEWSRFGSLSFCVVVHLRDFRLERYSGLFWQRYGFMPFSCLITTPSPVNFGWHFWKLLSHSQKVFFCTKYCFSSWFKDKIHSQWTTGSILFWPQTFLCGIPSFSTRAMGAQGFNTGWAETRRTNFKIAIGDHTSDDRREGQHMELRTCIVVTTL